MKVVEWGAGGRFVLLMMNESREWDEGDDIIVKRA